MPEIPPPPVATVEEVVVLASVTPLEVAAQRALADVVVAAVEEM